MCAMATFAATLGAAMVFAGSLVVGSAAVRAEGDPTRGEIVAQQWCSACHVTEVADSATDGAPAWRTIAMDSTVDEGYLRSLLDVPHGQMQHLELTDEQITDVLAYIMTLGFE